MVYQLEWALLYAMLAITYLVNRRVNAWCYWSPMASPPISTNSSQYLRHDAKKAVEDNAMKCVFSYCLTLDPNADQYVSRIFGENHYSIVDNVERLPERLPDVFAALTG